MMQPPQDDEQLRDALTRWGADLSEPTVAYALQEHAKGDPSHLVRWLILRVIWDEIADERPSANGTPRWVERWLELEPTGFPFIDVPALRRLIKAGVDLDDLTAVVRSAQVLMGYNSTTFLDQPWDVLRCVLGDELAQRFGFQVVLADNDAQSATRVGELHEGFSDGDPSGRGSDPRSLRLREFQKLPRDAQRELAILLLPGGKQNDVAAAQFWKARTGCNLKEARDAAAELRLLARRHRRLFEAARDADSVE